ncbi:hypothetical protein Pmani_015518 [Petrolisthes manimaculis]|uniref:Short-chain dehydrogenase/reductase 3 n=1 Tax=Petrolisthes manimaculis TaxID=1843537 RepID=A0AAE1PTE0_9EUCA|nr:hypothetical protein Pmani_015518 [Petrolisthes manimaculis]
MSLTATRVIRMFTGLMVVYQLVLLVTDLLHLMCRSLYLTLRTAWCTLSPPRPKSIVGEVVLVTGAGHGIGRELSLQFGRLGAKVICLDINETTNKKTVSDINLEGGAAWGYQCDVSSREEIRQAAAQVRSDVGEVTILVNNAGIMPAKPFLRHSPEDITNIFSVNIFSHFWMVQEWLPSFITQGSGHIVAISSIAGLMATSNLVPYCSTKYAVKGLMDGLTEELRYADRHPNIHLTCVHPFIVDTGLSKNPRIRFPSINVITSPAQCATRIIDGVRREEEVICIPGRDYYFIKLMNILPREVYKAVLDFFDTGMDEDDE